MCACGYKWLKCASYTLCKTRPVYFYMCSNDVTRSPELRIDDVRCRVTDLLATRTWHHNGGPFENWQINNGNKYQLILTWGGNGEGGGGATLEE